MNSLRLTLAVLLGGPTPRYTQLGPPMPHIGGWMLLTEGATAGPEGQTIRQPPFFLDGAGRPTVRGPWLNRPLQVVGETATSSVIHDEKGLHEIYLPKRNIEKKAAFPLTAANTETQRLASELVGKRVWFNGQPQFPCEIVHGYHAQVLAESARVLSVWQLDPAGVNVSPQGGLVDGGSIQNDRMGTTTTLVMLGEPKICRPSVPAWNRSKLDTRLNCEVKHRNAAPRCPPFYASSENVRRNLVTSSPQKLSGMPQSAAQQERWLVGKSRKQILATFGSPNEPGTLAAIMGLPIWHYGAVAYASIVFTFDAAGKVFKAVIATSP
ncbi:MAG: hypothetical protein JWQ08_2159 [Deinococcus sp.]|nr:hypothetical protein [Deinococcus sp.]